MKIKVTTNCDATFVLNEVEHFSMNNNTLKVYMYKENKLFTGIKKVETLEEPKEQFVWVTCYNNLDEFRAGCPKNVTKCLLDKLNEIVKGYLSKYAFLKIEECQ